MMNLATKDFEELYKSLNRLIVYRNILKDKVIVLLNEAMEAYINKNIVLYESKLFELYYALLESSEKNNYTGDVWKKYIVNLIMMDVNVFSLSCERGQVYINNSIKDSTIYKITLNDFKIIKQLYSLEIFALPTRGIDSISNLGEYIVAIKNEYRLYYDEYMKHMDILDNVFNEDDYESIANAVANYYSLVGCGEFSKYVAFKWCDDSKQLLPIKQISNIMFKDIIGYDRQKNALRSNTENFIETGRGNNVLLFGDKGTGKSSSIKALINEYGVKGLRLIEITKEQLKDFNKIAESVKDRGYKFIVFLDDLSFDEFEIEYKYMKSIIDGSLEVKPENVLIYATSNRRHLIKETWKDRSQEFGEISISEGQQERLSLVDRFGMSLMFLEPNKEQYLDVVHALARDNDIDMPKDELEAEALKWEKAYNGRSGRTAQQFINSISNQ